MKVAFMRGSTTVFQSVTVHSFEKHYIHTEGETAVQSTHSQKPSYSWLSVITTWMGAYYVFGFAPASQFLQSQLCADATKNPSDETTNWGPPQTKVSHVHTHVPIPHINAG